ncbi:uncharacterized protein MKZ38_004174 [Zalerion maritima]|uniref:Uncharacterized protein n=1 Tax=Zalerion maritima TaxID=339359 RepID=A0AAD5RLU9_9PEZI|nr:uncharacterized protein MKZ38_004174 [Zalerion maritima]
MDLGAYHSALARHANTASHTLPSREAVDQLHALLASSTSPGRNPGLPEQGKGASSVLSNIANTIVPSLNGQATTSRYYGFVSGGSHPVAQAADNAVTALDQNVMVHLPDQSAATMVEDVALRGLLELVNLDEERWKGRTFTTGATGSNVLGLACGRDYVLAKKLQKKGNTATPDHLGILGACLGAGVKSIRILSSGSHSTIGKAASVVGLGRASIVELPFSESEPWRLDLAAVEAMLQENDSVNIVSISAGEVNTGRFATTGLEDMKRLRDLADEYDSWIHVDGAFGIFARSLPATDEFKLLKQWAEGIELADSITADGHKCLNVPYDTGIFFCKHLDVQTRVFSNGSAAYLSGGSSEIPSPMNLGLENSRRFRALPVYALLQSEGREGMQQMFVRMVRMARAVAASIRTSEHYELLPSVADQGDKTHIIVLFRAKNDDLNRVLVSKINQTGRMYVSGTMWNGQPACRVAVANWKVNVDEDIKVVEEILNTIAGNS